jgi:hypothetical protein
MTTKDKCPECGGEMGPPIITERSFGAHDESYVLEHSYCLGDDDKEGCGYKRCEGLSFE